MLPVTERKVVLVPNSLAITAAVVCLGLYFLDPANTEPVSDGSVRTHAQAPDNQDGSEHGQTRSTRSQNQAGSSDRQRDQVRLPDVGSLTELLLPGRRTGN